VLATKGVVLGKFERHGGIKIRSMNQMVIGLENDPTTRPRIHPKMGMGPRVKKHQRTNEKTKK
jgi:hypothetical protein